MMRVLFTSLFALLLPSSCMNNLYRNLPEGSYNFHDHYMEGSLVNELYLNEDGLSN